MKKKIFSVLFALVLVLSFSLVAVPTNVTADPGQIITSVSRGSIVVGPSPGGLQENSRTYADRNYIWQNVPVELLGADYVMTYCTDKNNSGVSYAVTLSQDATLYVLIDDRYIAGTGWRSSPYVPLLDPPFPWLTDSSAGAVFTDTGLRLSHTGYHSGSNLCYQGQFWVYAANVSAGTYTLGPTCGYEPYRSSRTFYGIAAMIRLEVEVDIEKELLEGPEEIEIYLLNPTQYIFEIAYSGPAAKVIDTVPAEFEILGVDASDGDATYFETSQGRGKSATRIVWDVPAGSNTLTVSIQTVKSPGKGHKETVFKPTSCGPLPLNDGAIAYEVDESWNLVLVEVVDPETGEITLVPVVIVGPSNALVVEAVGEEDEDDDDD